MKKTVFTIVTALALISSCKQKEVVGPSGTNGTNGTSGTNGTNGKDGNANVKTYSFMVGVDDWKSGRVQGGYEDSVGWYTTIKNIDILTKSIIDSGMYYLMYTADQTNGKDWESIPTIRLQSVTNGPNTLTLPLQISYSVNDYTAGEIVIKVSNPDLKKISNPSALLYNQKQYYFRLFVIEGK